MFHVVVYMRSGTVHVDKKCKRNAIRQKHSFLFKEAGSTGRKIRQDEKIWNK